MKFVNFLRWFCFCLPRWMDEQFCRTCLFTSCYHCCSWGGISEEL